MYCGKRETREEEASRNRRMIEALYRKGYSCNDIMKATRLDELTVLNVMQRLFALEMMRKEGELINS